MMEILNEDVACSHGATISPMEEEPLFYLQSRGIDPAEALRMAVLGFFEEGLNKLPDSVRQDVESTLQRRIGRLEGMV